jgi:hypothetical protein
MPLFSVISTFKRNSYFHVVVKCTMADNAPHPLDAVTAPSCLYQAVTKNLHLHITQSHMFLTLSLQAVTIGRVNAPNFAR